MLICLRIIIELHKQFRPPISQEVNAASSPAVLVTEQNQAAKATVDTFIFLTDSSFSGLCEANLQRSAKSSGMYCCNITLMNHCSFGARYLCMVCTITRFKLSVFTAHIGGLFECVLKVSSVYKTALLNSRFSRY